MVIRVLMHSHESVLEALNQRWFGGGDALLQPRFSLSSMAVSNSQHTPWLPGLEAESWDPL